MLRCLKRLISCIFTKDVYYIMYNGEMKDIAIVPAWDFKMTQCQDLCEHNIIYPM